MSGKKSRDKGARAELEVAELLRPVYPKARRRVAGEESQDDAPGRDIAGTPGLCVQVSCRKSDPKPVVKLSEAIHAAKADEIPVVWFRQTSGPMESRKWVVGLRPGDFLALMLLWRTGQTTEGK